MSAVSGGTASQSGTIVLDYGTVPAAEAAVAVAGQNGIRSTSRVRVWLDGHAMSDNSATEHLMGGALIRLTPSQPVDNDGFTIYADNIGGLATGMFRVSWIWSA